MPSALPVLKRAREEAGRCGKPCMAPTSSVSGPWDQARGTPQFPGSGGGHGCGHSWTWAWQVGLNLTVETCAPTAHASEMGRLQ